MFKEIIHLLKSINNHLAEIQESVRRPEPDSLLDNSKINAHEGEVVLTAHSDLKNLNDLAEAIYPKLKKLEAWGH
jgi:hypothetical protein